MAVLIPANHRPWPKWQRSNEIGGNVGDLESFAFPGGMGIFVHYTPDRAVRSLAGLDEQGRKVRQALLITRSDRKAVVEKVYFGAGKVRGAPDTNSGHADSLSSRACRHTKFSTSVSGAARPRSCSTKSGLSAEGATALRF
jgi:hypothetical protein